jgi:ABC-type nitrate/sulfonate/bicarbonate transport system substrate-binding protein
MNHTKRTCKFFAPAMLGLMLLFGGNGYSAEVRKMTVGYSTVGPAGTGLWMAKEIGAFERYGINAAEQHNRQARA